MEPPAEVQGVRHGGDGNEGQAGFGEAGGGDQPGIGQQPARIDAVAQPEEQDREGDFERSLQQGGNLQAAGVSKSITDRTGRSGYSRGQAQGGSGSPLSRQGATTSRRARRYPVEGP